jgi:hypothetical protein
LAGDDLFRKRFLRELRDVVASCPEPSARDGVTVKDGEWIITTR